MLPAVWNVAEPLEVEYRWPIHQSSDQSNSGRKEIEKPPCGEELRSRRDQFRGRSGFLEIVFVGQCEVLVCL